MNSSEKTKMSNSGALYTPPRVVRISELRTGGGMGAAQAPCNTGSGAGLCAVGQIPQNFCDIGNVPPTPTQGPQ